MKPEHPDSNTLSQSDKSSKGTSNTTTRHNNSGASGSSKVETNSDDNRAFDYTMLSDGPGTADNLATTTVAFATSNQHETPTVANTATSTITARASVSSIPVEKQLSPFDATIHLLKGNLGPGCLNLPAAFALTGCVLGSALFFLVACQGIYTMWLLVECKTLLADKYDREHQLQQRHPPQGGDLEHDEQQQMSVLLTAENSARVRSELTTTSAATHGGSSTMANTAAPPQWTFMACARASLGSVGGRVVEVLLFVVQSGVCCVFISLLSTNLEAAFPSLGSFAAVCCVTFVLLFMVLLRFIKDLLWLSATANLCMIIAIFTSTLAGIIVAVIRRQDNLQQQQLDEINNENGLGDDGYGDDTSTQITYFNPSLSAIITFMADLFYAFEGIGLVLPIENSFGVVAVAGQDSGTPPAPPSSLFQPVLIRSMTIVAILFLCIGIAGSVGFPDIVGSGSVTAFLELTYPDVLWFSVVNYLVILAVAMTFPLQLTPAMEVLDGWLSGGCGCFWRSNRRELELVPTEDDHEERASRDLEHREAQGIGDADGRRLTLAKAPLQSNGDAIETFNDEEHHRESAELNMTGNCCGAHEWIFRRWAMVLLCSGVVLAVKNNLGILMAFFGAVGQTGLAGMPCAVHLSLQRQGIAPPNRWKSFLDVAIISFCFMVMVAGVIESVHDVMIE